MTSSVLRAGLALGLVLAAGCSSGPDLGPGALVVIGTIEGAPSQSLVLTPAPLVAGKASQVIVNSFGPSSCTKPDHAVVDQEDTLATVTPYDLVAPADVECTRDIAPQPHPVMLRFTAGGEGVLRVIGYRFDKTSGARRLDTVTVRLPVLGD
ncbi:MAG TPA: hypothetical protein VFS40_09380 [Gemmatimonadales bacterium]|nr:hypothetical protein [Gemmatimonadales bacterium]